MSPRPFSFVRVGGVWFHTPMYKRAFAIPLMSAGIGSGLGYLGADKDEKGEGATRGALKGLGIGAGAELGALGGLAAAYQGAKHLPMLPGTSKATALILALAGAAGGGYAGHKLTNMVIGQQHKKAFTVPAFGSLGSVMGYRNAPDDAKGEGAYRGAVQGVGTGMGAAVGAVGAGALGGSYLVDNQSLNPGQKALSLLALAILGAGAGGAAGYGISRGALGNSSWENKREQAEKANEGGIGGEEEEEEVAAPKMAASVQLKLAGDLWNKHAGFKAPELPPELAKYLPYLIGAGAGAGVGALATGQDDPDETVGHAASRKIRNMLAGGLAGAGSIYAAHQARPEKSFTDHLMLSFSPFNS